MNLLLLYPDVLTQRFLAGLLTLRERQNLSVYAHKRVHTVLSQNSIFNVLNPEFVDRRELIMNKRFELKNKNGIGLGIEIEAFEVPGKIALWLEEWKQKRQQVTLKLIKTILELD